MAKIGRNDPCSCGSGKKYKRCCGLNQTSLSPTDPGGISVLDDVEQFDVPQLDVPQIDSKTMERALSVLQRGLANSEFETPEEMIDAIMKTDLDEILQPGALRTALDEAQDLMYEAWDATGAARARLARKALKVSPDCADAYLLLANETAKNEDEALDLCRKAMAAGERSLGPERFSELTGEFWAVLETRPYMRARASLASLLWEIGDVDEALDHYVAMLKLNPNDDQGIRYILLTSLIELGLDQPARTLLEKYSDEGSAIWAYGRALLAFRAEGSTRSSNALLRKANKVNPVVPTYLLNPDRPPAESSEFMGVVADGLLDDGEAIFCVNELLPSWQTTPGAFDWLRQVVGEPEVKQAAQSEKVPKSMQASFDALTQITDRVCAEHLNDEYRDLSRRLAAALCRKRPSPVSRGRIETWACGIVYAIGSVNYIFDKSQDLYFSATDLCALFGVAATTGANKAAEIRRMFKMDPWFNQEWELPSHRESNPMTWMFNLNGVIVDARTLPSDLQEWALRQGLIPHLPESSD